MQGFKPDKTRLQGQDSRFFQQTDFRGGQNSDMPGTRIGLSDMAMLENVVAYAGGLEGGAGARLASPDKLPGSGTRHYLAQHPISGRWIHHRGGKLFVSRGRKPQEWSEVTTIGPDGSLTVNGSFTGTTGAGDLAGSITSKLSNMVLQGMAAGQVLNVTVEDAGSGSYEIQLLSGATVVASSGAVNYSDTPGIVDLLEEAGSGISGTVQVGMLVMPNLPLSGTFTANTNIVGGPFVLNGLTAENTDNFDLYWNIAFDGSNYTLILYKDAAKTQSVATYSGETVTTTVNITPLNSSGIFGTVQFDDNIVGFTFGEFSGTTLEFELTPISIDADSKVASFGQTGFIVWVQGESPRTVYAEADIGKYWFLSELSGYPDTPMDSGGGGDFSYRLTGTFSRIVDPVTRAPSYGGNRLTALLEFEGPNNRHTSGYTDYATRLQSAPISDSNPMVIPLTKVITGVPYGVGAAAYITHISLYRTVNVGPGSSGSKTVYIWIADVPIYQLSYSDTTTDEILLSRFQGGAEQGENFALRSQFFSGMSKGLGCLRPDFMATAIPGSDRVDYCDVGTYPRFIGYHYPARQFFPTQDPVTGISATKSELVVHCPKSTYVANPGITIDVGIPGVVSIPVIQYFERAGQTIGVRSGQRTFPVDDGSFIALCSDGTVRVWSSGQWGDPLDGTKVSKLVQLALPGATLAFVDGVILMWYATSTDEDAQAHCVRLGSGGKDGFGWAQIGRDKWPSAVLGGGCVQVYEREDATTALVVVDADTDTLFAVEDQPPQRQYKDDVPGRAPFIGGTDLIANIVCAGWDYTILYGVLTEDAPNDWHVRVYTDEAHTNLVMQSASFSEPTEALELFGAPTATLDVLALVNNLEFEIRDGVKIASQADIVCEIACRELEATQESFHVIHQQSHLSMRNPYGLPMPTVTAKWYGNGILLDAAEVPVAGDIQSFRRIEGKRIQVRYVMSCSGWVLPGFDTRYQTHDIQSSEGPANSGAGSIQKALATDMIVWVNGESGILNRASASGASFVGAVPSRIDGPYGSINGQRFLTPVTLADLETITNFSMMFWARNPLIGAEPIANSPFVGFVNDTPAIYAAFPDANTIDIGPFQYPLDPPVGDNWDHFCITRDGEYFSLYRNGVLIRKDLMVPGSTLNLTSFRIGSPAGEQLEYDLRVYDKCLSATEVAYYFDNIGMVP